MICSESQGEGEDQPAGKDCLSKKVAGTDSATASKNTKVEAVRHEASSAGMENSCTLPPGQHPYDPGKKDIDPIGFALYRVQTFLIWIDEHRASFEKLRHTDQEAAEIELSNLRDSTVQGMIYLQRLSELLLASYTIDPNKRLPESLRRGWFSSYVKQLPSSEPESQSGKEG